jgi:hypothetical protein
MEKRTTDIEIKLEVINRVIQAVTQRCTSKWTKRQDICLEAFAATKIQ